MNKVKIKLDIDGNDLKQVEALNVFLKSLGDETPKTVRKPRKQKPAEKAEPAVDQNAANKKEVVDEEVVDGAISINDVRKLMSLKNTPETRPLLKAKLTELGSKNVTTLDPKHYQEFSDYMSTL